LYNFDSYFEALEPKSNHIWVECYINCYFRNCTRLLVGGAGRYKWRVPILSVCKNVPNNFGHNLSLRQNWFFIPRTGFLVPYSGTFFYTVFSLSLVRPRKVVGTESLCFQFCDVSQTGNYPQWDLAKFGYRPDMIVFFKKGQYFYIFGTCWIFKIFLFILFQFFDVADAVIIHKLIEPNLGIKKNRKVRSIYFWLPSWTICKNVAILKDFFETNVKIYYSGNFTSTNFIDLHIFWTGFVWSAQFSILQSQNEISDFKLFCSWFLFF
jgi:hypothetical protein